MSRAEQADDDLAVGERRVVVRDLAQPRLVGLRGIEKRVGGGVHGVEGTRGNLDGPAGWMRIRGRGRIRYLALAIIPQGNNTYVGRSGSATSAVHLTGRRLHQRASACTATASTT